MGCISNMFSVYTNLTSPWAREKTCRRIQWNFGSELGHNLNNQLNGLHLPGILPRRRRIVRCRLENSRAGICRNKKRPRFRRPLALIRLRDGSQRRPEIHRQQLWHRGLLSVVRRLPLLPAAFQFQRLSFQDFSFSRPTPPFLFPIVQRRHGDLGVFRVSAGRRTAPAPANEESLACGSYQLRLA